MLKKSNLEVEIEAFAQVNFFWEAFVFTHIEGQSVVAICILTLRKEHGVVETHKFSTRHPLKVTS